MPENLRHGSYGLDFVRNVINTTSVYSSLKHSFDHYGYIFKFLLL